VRERLSEIKILKAALTRIALSTDASSQAEQITAQQFLQRVEFSG
jgi:hypothetical protein